MTSHRPQSRRPSGAPAALLVLVALLTWGNTSCGPPPAGASPARTEEQRLLREIIRRQEERVAEAASETATLQDALADLRLRQRILDQYGRPDLAAALEPEAELQAERLRALQARLADADEALRAYRDYASRSRAEGPAGRGR